MHPTNTTALEPRRGLLNVDRRSSRRDTSLLSSISSLRASAQPYLEVIRFNKPQGTILVFWPFIWGLTFSASNVHLHPATYASYTLKFLLCAFLLRSLACTINDILDRDIDGKVERTKNRPIPAGRLSARNAFMFFIVQVIVTLAFFSSFNLYAFSLGVLFIFPWIVVYPTLKRFTNWPQAWLGIAANWGIPMAWAAVADTLKLDVVLCLMVSAWSWTMLYDTVYACQDKSDDLKVGIKSTAIAFGSKIRQFLIIDSMIFVLMLACAGVLNNQGLWYFLLSVGGTTVHVSWQLLTVDLDNPKSCWANFRHNGDLGYIIWSGMLVDYFLRLRAGV